MSDFETVKESLLIPCWGDQEWGEKCECHDDAKAALSRIQARLSAAEQQAQSNARAYEDWRAAADERDRLQARLSAAEEERDQLRADRRNWPCHPAEELQARLKADVERQIQWTLAAESRRDRAEAVVETVARLRFIENDDFGARMVRAEGDFAAVLDAVRQYEEGR